MKKIRLLWCCSSILPAVAERLGQKRAMAIPWAARLLDFLRTSTEFEICVVMKAPKAWACDFVEHEVRYFVHGQARRLHHWTYNWDGFRETCQFARNWAPELIHIHGTENYFGLVPSYLRIPCATVVSIQGLLCAVAPKALGDLSFSEVLRNERPLDVLRMSGVLGTRRAWQLGAHIEERVLRQNHDLLGRTAWDREQVKMVNPAARYHHVGEILRPEFSEGNWTRASATPFSMFFSNLGGAHKGGHTILRALPSLIRDFPLARVRVAGRVDVHRGYGRMFIREARRLGVADRVEFLGFLDAQQIVQELERAHVFVSASHIDNSPNSLAEAQVVGTPVVASYVGGVPEMVGEGRAGVLFPAGDPQLLANAVARVFRDDGLAQTLSVAGRELAVPRHDPQRVLEQLLAAYRQALSHPKQR